MGIFSHTETKVMVGLAVLVLILTIIFSFQYFNAKTACYRYGMEMRDIETCTGPKGVLYSLEYLQSRDIIGLTNTP